MFPQLLIDAHAEAWISSSLTRIRWFHRHVFELNRTCYRCSWWRSQTWPSLMAFRRNFYINFSCFHYALSIALPLVFLNHAMIYRPPFLIIPSSFFFFFLGQFFRRVILRPSMIWSWLFGFFLFFDLLFFFAMFSWTVVLTLIIIRIEITFWIVLLMSTIFWRFRFTTFLSIFFIWLRTLFLLCL